MIAINLTSVYYVTKAFAPSMVRQRYGRIIMMASVAARTGARYIAAYARRAYAFYRPGHVERAVAMIMKAVGLNPRGRLSQWLSRLATWFMQLRADRLARAGA